MGLVWAAVLIPGIAEPIVKRIQMGKLPSYETCLAVCLLLLNQTSWCNTAGPFQKWGEGSGSGQPNPMCLGPRSVQGIAV